MTTITRFNTQLMTVNTDKSASHKQTQSESRIQVAEGFVDIPVDIPLLRCLLGCSAPCSGACTVCRSAVSPTSPAPGIKQHSQP